MEVRYMFRTLEGSKKEKVESERKLKVKPLLPPSFSGEYREYGDFKCDYDRLMQDNHGKDAYTLRSCLSGEALEVRGVENDFDEMFKRLDHKYADNRKLIDVVVNDLKISNL